MLSYLLAGLQANPNVTCLNIPDLDRARPQASLRVLRACPDKHS